jgi:hypothetical protein
MRRVLWTMTVAAGVTGGLAACDRPPQPQPTAPGGPATQPAAAVASADPLAATTAPVDAAATQPTASALSIRGKLVSFPPAVLRLEEDDGGITCLLYSDDPKTAMEDGYDGNSYYLRFPLDIDDPARLPTAVWTYKATTSQPEESPYGIFLEGRRWQLHPDDVRVEFQGTPDAPPVTVWLGGMFRAVNTIDDPHPGQQHPQVTVMGKLTASLQQGRRKG